MNVLGFLLLAVGGADVPAFLTPERARVGERVRYTVSLPDGGASLLALPPLPEGLVLLDHGFVVEEGAAPGWSWFLEVLAEIPGSHTLGPVEFGRAQERLRGAPRTLTVASHFAGGEAVMDDLLPPLPPASGGTVRRWFVPGIAALVLLALVLVAAGRRGDRHRAVVEPPPELAAEPDPAAIRAYYAVLCRRLRQAVAQRFAVPAGRLTVEEIAPRLRASGASREIAAAITAFLEAAERTRFAHRPTTAAEARRAGGTCAELVRNVGASGGTGP